MRSIAIFASAFFYCAATAVASQPAKIELHGVSRNAVALRTVQKGKGDKPTLKGPISLVKTEKIKVKKDTDNSDRRLGQKGSIRGGTNKDSVQRERSLQDLKTNSAFAAAMAVTSAGSGRRLEDIPCSEMADGSLLCRLEGYPDEGFHVDFSCPASASTLSDCSTCNVISDESAEQCSSCTICSDTVAYDCSNIAEGGCVIQDCSGKCAQQPTTPTPTNPKPTTPTPTNPKPTTPKPTTPKPTTPKPTTAKPTDPPPTDTPADIQCSEMADGSLTCRWEDYPGEDFHVDFSCPGSASYTYDCSTCEIVSDDTGRQCNSCTVCSDSSSDSVAFDCSNIAEGECVIRDCDGNCNNPTTTDTPPPDTTPTTPATLPPGPSYCGDICIPENELCVYEVCCCNQKGCDYMYDPFTGQSWALCM